MSDVRESVKAAAVAAGMIDPDFVTLPEFADVIGLVREENGRVVNLDLAVETMRTLKPAAFGPPPIDWATLSPAEFEQQEQILRGNAGNGGSRFLNDDEHAKARAEIDRKNGVNR